jgi:hypothetical protein
MLTRRRFLASSAAMFVPSALRYATILAPLPPGSYLVTVKQIDEMGDQFKLVFRIVDWHAPLDVVVVQRLRPVFEREKLPT